MSLRRVYRVVHPSLFFAQSRALCAAHKGHETPLTVLSGVPKEHATRRLRIYRPTKSAMQQGRGSTNQLWKAEFEKKEGADRWTNPLMGWTSTGDPLSNMGMNFPSKEAAVDYANRNGFGFVVYEPEQEKKNVRSISAYKKSMVHHWAHKAPIYEQD